MKIYFVRGLPGSGKSTYAKKILRADTICEADDFFTKDGKYLFNPKKLNKAHEMCYKKFIDAIDEALKNPVKKNSIIAVCNTFSRKWEIKKYIDYCKNNNLNYIIIKMDTQYKNIHNVPERSIENMKERWENLNEEKHIY